MPDPFSCTATATGSHASPVIAALSAAIFTATFVLLALGRLHRFAVPRGAAALAGAAATLVVLAPLGLMPWRAWCLIDWQVILLLTGLMALAALAQLVGLFAGLRRRLAHAPAWLALWVSLLTIGIASALILNDAAVVVLVPFLLPVLRNHGLPLPRSVALMAVAANVGSLLTPFGNPQDAVLAHAAHLGLLDFLRVQGPLVVLGMLLLAFASRLAARGAMPPPPMEVPHAVARHRAWVAAAIAAFVALALVAPAWLGAWACLAAAGAALAAAVWMRGEAVRAALRGVDLNVLALFVGMYVLTGGLSAWFPSATLSVARLDAPATAALGTTFVSNAIGNVPAILTFLRLDPAWTIGHAPFLVATSTLGGALLLTGSAASLLAADVARKDGVEVRFGPFLRDAVPWVLPLLIVAAWWTW